MPGESAFEVWNHLVPQSHISKRPAHHYFVIAAARSVGIKLCRLHAVFLQIFTGRAVSLDGTRRRNVVGGHAVPEDGKRARILDISNETRFHWHIVEIWRALDVG